MNIYRSILTLLLVATLAACGGGSGSSSSDFNGSADVSIHVSPRSIDPGDRLDVEVQISNVSDAGVDLKFRFPKGLSYVAGSSFLIVDGQSVDIDPDFLGLAALGDLRYLVYYMTREIFGNSNNARVQFQLRGDAAIEDSKIEVDADVGERNFDVDQAEFQAEDDISISVGQ